MSRSKATPLGRTTRTRHRQQRTVSRKNVADLVRLCRGNCMLCERPAVSIGIWFPTETLQLRLGKSEGKERRVVVPFCGLHAATPDASMALAQELILAQAEAAMGKPGLN